MVDSGGWLKSRKFLLPADRISADEKHEEDFAADATKQQIESSPRYNQKSLSSKDEWKKDEEEFKKFWHDAPVMHRRGSDRIITPPEEPSSSVPASAAPGTPEYTAADLYPERLVDKFSDPKPGGHKVTLTPRAVSRAEEAARGVTLLKPRWDAFEEHLSRNRQEIQAQCPECTPGAERKRDVA